LCPSDEYHSIEDYGYEYYSESMLFSRTLFCLACFLSWLPLGPCATPIAKADASVATVTSRSATSADGMRIVYDVRGHSDTTLFFVHCWACNRSFWRDQVDVFASRFRVVTIDLPGYGDSGHDSDPSARHWVERQAMVTDPGAAICAGRGAFCAVGAAWGV
jgi:hypothetical protein